MATTGEKLVELSGLSTGTALTHLLAIAEIVVGKPGTGKPAASLGYIGGGGIENIIFSQEDQVVRQLMDSDLDETDLGLGEADDNYFDTDIEI